MILRAWRVLRQEGLALFLKRAIQRVRGKLFPPPPPPPLPDRYPEWIARSEPGLEDLAKQRISSAALAYRPLISMITPIYNPELGALREMIESVLAQTYEHWELCLLDGGSDRLGVQETLAAFAAQEPRLRVQFASENQGISVNSNAAIAMARGEFLAFLDHDDTLAPFALYEVALKLNDDSAYDLIYSDHDLLSPKGLRHDPLFKPDWSPEIMLSANYITHLTVIRASLVRELGGFDPQSDGAQDWDLFLRVSEQTNRIAHIPKVLYHWREADGSTSQDIWVKPYAPTAQLRSIAAHLSRLGLASPWAFFETTGYIRVRWQVEKLSRVSIIIPSNGCNPLLENCVRSILSRTSYPDYELLIVNNGSRRPEEFPGYRQMQRDQRVRILHYDLPFNYSAVNNFGVIQASGELLLFLNNDTEIIDPEWLNELVLWAQRAEIGAVGAKLLQPSGVIQHAGIVIGLTGLAGHIFAGCPENRWTVFGLAEWYRDYSAVTAACLMMRRNVFEQIGGFDERFILCGNDVELCLRVRQAGLRVIVNPFARLRHIEGATRQGNIPAADYHTSYPHYLPILRSGDPYFNPNLSYWELPPTIAGVNEQEPQAYMDQFLRRLG